MSDSFVKLDRNLLNAVKKAFVAMPSGQPAAGAGMMTQAQASPMGGTPQMDPAMMGGDPAAMGGAPMDPAMAGGDPAAMGGAPMDPAAAGGAMPPMDPAMMGGGAPAGQVTMSVQELIQLLQAMQGMGGKVSKPKADANGGAAGGNGGNDIAALNAKIDQLMTVIGGAMPSQQ